MNSFIERFTFIPLSCFLIVTYIVTYSQNQTQDKDTNSGHKIVSTIFETFEFYKHTNFTIDTKVYFDTPIWPERNVLKYQITNVCYVDYPRYRQKDKMIIQYYYKGQKDKYKYSREMVRNDKKQIFVFNEEEERQGEVYKMDRMTTWEEKDERDDTLLSEFAHIYGYLRHEYEAIFLYNVLTSSIDKISQFVNERSKNIIISFSSNYGEYTISIKLDEKYNRYIVEQIYYTRKLHHWYKPNTPLFMYPVGKHPDYPKSSLEQETEVIRYGNYKVFDNNLVFTDIYSRSEKFYRNGQKVTEDRYYKIENIRPKFDVNIITIPDTVPNGTRVLVFKYDQETDSMKASEGIQYIWRDGQIVKKVPQGVLEKLTGAEFEGVSIWSRGLIVILVLLTLTLITAVFVYHRRHRNT